MNKFNGKNSYNNRVHVDYRRKYVHFKPIKGDWTEASPYRMFWVQITSFFILTSLPTFLITIIILRIMGCGFDIIQGVILVWYGFCMLSAWFVSLIYMNKKWRETEFPKFNYFILNKVRRITKLNKKSTKIKIIKPDNVINNKIFIPHFNNVMFSYRTVGDFSKIKNIDIINTFDDDPMNWYCQIEFIKRPKKGFMELRYF